MPLLSRCFDSLFATAHLRSAQTRVPAGAQSQCPVCAESACHLIATKGREGEPLTTVACAHCELFRVDPLPAAAEIERFHEREYRSRYKGVRRPKLKHVHRSGMLAVGRLRQLATYLRRRSTVLDIGCASGEWLYILGAERHSSVGIEVDPSYADFGRGEYGVDIRFGSVLANGFPDRTFDCVAMFHVLEHMPNPLAVLDRVRGWLKPDGVLAIEVPNVNSPPQHPGKRFHYAHVVGYTPGSLAYAVQKAGWRIVELSLDSYERNIFAVLDRRSGAVCGAYEGQALKSIMLSPPIASSASATIRHYLRSSTYSRWRHRMKQFGAEVRAVKRGMAPREILESSLRDL